MERYWGDLCDDQDVDIVHTVYETIRDCYKQRAAGASSTYNPEDHLALKCASLHSLTVLLVEVNLITRDHRMVKFHVDHLVRLLFSGVSDDDVIAKATNLWLLRATASTCLCMMEKDVPTLLARQGAMYAREAMAEEGSTAVKGFPKTSLAVTVLANIPSIPAIPTTPAMPTTSRRVSFRSCRRTTTCRPRSGFTSRGTWSRVRRVGRG